MILVWGLCLFAIIVGLIVLIVTNIKILIDNI